MRVRRIREHVQKCCTLVSHVSVSSIEVQHSPLALHCSRDHWSRPAVCVWWEHLCLLEWDSIFRGFPRLFLSWRPNGRTKKWEFIRMWLRLPWCANNYLRLPRRSIEFDPVNLNAAILQICTICQMLTNIIRHHRLLQFLLLMAQKWNLIEQSLMMTSISRKRMSERWIEAQLVISCNYQFVLVRQLTEKLVELFYFVLTSTSGEVTCVFWDL